MTVIELKFPLPPPGLRRNHGQTRYTSALRAEYAERVHMEALGQGWRPGEALTGSIKVSLRWLQVGHGDTDNCLAGAKVLFDCLGSAPRKPGRGMTYLGVYGDDAQIVAICIERERVATKPEEAIILRLEEA